MVGRGDAEERDNTPRCIHICAVFEQEADAGLIAAAAGCMNGLDAVQDARGWLAVGEGKLDEAFKYCNKKRVRNSSMMKRDEREQKGTDQHCRWLLQSGGRDLGTEGGDHCEFWTM